MSGSQLKARINAPSMLTGAEKCELLAGRRGVQSHPAAIVARSGAAGAPDNDLQTGEDGARFYRATRVAPFLRASLDGERYRAAVTAGSMEARDARTAAGSGQNGRTARENVPAVTRTHPE